MECRRCGTCCRKGGPALHVSDRPIWDRKRIGPERLLTLRRGELVRDPQSEGAARPLEAELLKVRGREGTWACTFYEQGRGCAIYEDRPLECRELFCQDTAGLLAAMAEPRLTRFDLLPPEHPLVELAREHQARTDLEAIGRLAGDFRQGVEAAGEDILRAAHYDQALRQTLGERGFSEESLEFLLGRALWRILAQWGMELRRTAQGYKLVVVEKS